MAWKLVIIQVYILVMLIAFWKEEQGGSFSDALKSGYVVPAFFVAAVALRLALALSPEGFYNDINIFKAWCDYCAEGFTSLYRNGHFVDYPPFIMYFLVIFGLLRKRFGFSYDSLVFTFMIKLLGIVFDIAMCMLIYRLSIRKLSVSKAALLTAALSLNPAIIFDSGVWGQVDSMLVFPLILTMLFLDDGKPAFAGIAYRIAVMTKPQALLIGPVLLFYMICEKDISKLVKAVGAGVISIFVIILPFSVGSGFSWIVDLFISTMSHYSAYSMNAYNLYMLIGKNGVGIDTGSMAGYINYIVLVVSMATFFFVYRKKHEKNAAGEGMFESSLLFIFTFFTLCTMMHERYLYPAIVFAVIAFIYSKRNVFFYIFLALSFSTYANMAAVFYKFEGTEIPVLLEKSLARFEIIVFIITIYLLAVYPMLRKAKESRSGEHIEMSDGGSI